MVELLIRAHVPEWADKLDYSTLEKMPTELISKFLQRRYPDMIWRARTTDGETDVVFLMEVQGRPDLHMALRTANYAGLLIESIKEQGGLRPGGRLPEVVCIVLYHGNRPWNAPTRLADLFRHSPPNEYRLVSRRPADARTPPTSSDLPSMLLELAMDLEEMPSMLLELARDWTLEEMQSHLRDPFFAELGRVIHESGDEDFDRFMAGCVRAMLVLRGYSEELLEEAMTMERVVTKFERGLDDLVQQGRRQGQVRVLRELATRKFGPGTAHELSRLLERRSDSEHIDRAAIAILECDSGEDFIALVRQI